VAIVAISQNPPVSLQNLQRMQALTVEAKGLLPKVLADPGLPRTELGQLFAWAEDASLALTSDRRQLCAPLFEILRTSDVPQTTVLTIQGEFNTNYAWDARGSGWAKSVTDQGWQLFAQRLAKADGALEKAWALDNTNADAATDMIGVELGQGQGRDRMELWFGRAMAADQDNYAACADKLYYLEPKWYGNSHSMLVFGQECVDGKNWDAELPYILIEARLSLAQYSSKGYKDRAQAEYFQKNPDAWPQMRAVFAEYRKHRPLSVKHDLEIARVAAFCGQWDDVNFLLNEVGNATDTDAILADQLKALKAEAKQHPTTRRSEF
jgi:hypothetical protein